MIGGLAVGLLGVFGCQVLIGIPLLLPRGLHGPSIFLALTCARGAGLYIGGTLLASLAVLLATSIWELVALENAVADTDHKAMMMSVQAARAQLVITLCAAVIFVGIMMPRLAAEEQNHERLKKSHGALQRQAAGLSQEYSRATKEAKELGDAAAEGGEAALIKKQLDKVIQEKDSLAAKLDQAEDAKKNAEKALTDVKLQAKNLEDSFDALMRENIKLKGEQQSSKGDTWAFAPHRKDD